MLYSEDEFWTMSMAMAVERVVDVLVLCLVMQDFEDLGKTRQRRTGSVYERWGRAKKKEEMVMAT